MDELISRRLLDGAKKLGLEVSAQQLEQLQEYLLQLHKWNAVYNLTAIRQIDAMVGKHLLDSFSVVSSIRGDCVLDVGTGGGLPGVPIAILHPELAVTLLDSNRKKTRFLTHIQSHLALENVTVAHQRIEQFSSSQGFSTVISRAFASLSLFVTQCGRLCGEGGAVVAMLGRLPAASEIEHLREWQIDIKPVIVPELDGERHIARLTRGTGATSSDN